MWPMRESLYICEPLLTTIIAVLFDLGWYQHFEYNEEILKLDYNSMLCSVILKYDQQKMVPYPSQDQASTIMHGFIGHSYQLDVKHLP